MSWQFYCRVQLTANLELDKRDYKKKVRNMFKLALSWILLLNLVTTCSASELFENSQAKPKWLKAKRVRIKKRKVWKLWSRSRITERYMRDSAEKLLYVIDHEPGSPIRPFFLYQLARHLIDLDEDAAALHVIDAIDELPADTPYQWKYRWTTLSGLKREAKFMRLRLTARAGKPKEAEKIIAILKPEDGYEYLRIAESYVLLGNFPEAAKYLKKSHGEGHPDKKHSDELIRMYAAVLARTIGYDDLAREISYPVIADKNTSKPQSQAVYFILKTLNESIDFDRKHSGKYGYRSGSFKSDCRGYVSDIEVMAYFGRGNSNNGSGQKRVLRKIRILKHHESRPWSAISIIPRRVDRKSGLAVDAVTGATISSCAIMVAADNTYRQASGLERKSY